MAVLHRSWPIEELRSAAFVIPTDRPESDGTLSWSHTTLVLAWVRAGGQEGLGYSYTSAGARAVIHDTLRPVIVGADALSTPALWLELRRAIRNLGAGGIASHALSAVDVALWDLKAKLLGISMIDLMGPARRTVPVYGSGGFTSYDEATLCRQLAGWVEQGITRVKMKVGRDEAADVQRVRAARGAIGPEAELFVDANGAYTRKRALAQAQRFAEAAITWLEEPVTARDLIGLRLLRERAPSGMEIAAGEYGDTPSDFEHTLAEQAVDVLQADVTRCGGFTGFLEVAALADAHAIPLSCHCAPSLHASVGCAAQRVVHLEYFHDHVRIERQLFDGCLEPHAGALEPDGSRPGLGLALKAADAERFVVRSSS